MAAAIVPLVTSVIPAAIPVVVKLVERLLGPKTGTVKLDTASQITESIQAGLQNAQKLQGQPLKIEQIKALIEQTVTALNTQGVLQGAETALDSLHPVTQVDGVAQILAGVSRLLGKVS